jgi:ribonuclease HI
MNRFLFSAIVLLIQLYTSSMLIQAFKSTHPHLRCFIKHKMRSSSLLSSASDHPSAIYTELWHGYRYLGSSATNNEAEYEALLLLLEQCAAMEVKASILIQGDSSLVLNQISGEWKTSKPSMKVYCQRILSCISTWKDVYVQHIPRAMNSRADSLANYAMDVRASSGRNDAITGSVAMKIAASQPISSVIPITLADANEPIIPIKSTIASSTSHPDFRYLLRFDGGSRGNPGLAGAGGVIYRKQIHV